MLVLPFLHVHQVKQYGSSAKSVFKYSVLCLNRPQSMRFVYMATMLLVQTEVVTGWLLKMVLDLLNKIHWSHG